jgi:exopolysaccharide biosynthesis polyprenyl glycosylphosphotransferase
MKREVMLVDALCALLALCGADWLRFHVFSGIVGPQSHLQVALMIFEGMVLYLVEMQALEAYRRRVLLRFRRGLPLLFKAGFWWLILFPSLAFFLNVFPWVSRQFIVLGAVLLVVVGTLGRYFYQHYLLLSGRLKSLRQRVLFVDWTPRVGELVKELKKDPWQPYEVLGVCPPLGDHFTQTPTDPDIPILGSYRELDSFLSKGTTHILVLAESERALNGIASTLSVCERELVTFLMIPTGFQVLLGGLQITTMSRVPVLGVIDLPLQVPMNAWLKRIVDVIGSLVGIICFTPFIALFAFLVYKESPGPVFYRQVRVGRNGRRFSIIKIRSMRLDAEVGSGARWAAKGDDRRLSIGAFMRRWNIDELPQFWNVLMGDMSLVGPRPERPELIVNFKESIEHYNTRHAIVPGMTGWAQVNGLRGDTDLSERIRYDLYYIENWSLLLDLKIILLTAIEPFISKHPRNS